MVATIQPSLLYRHWVHSREEDAGGANVYRPAEYDFPPARGRTGFELHSDGCLTERGIGPTDRSTKTAGTWRLEDGNCLAFYTTSAEQPSRVLQIESLDRDRLVVRPNASACRAPTAGIKP